MRPGLHRGEGRVIEEMPRRLRLRRRDHDMIRVGEQLLQLADNLDVVDRARSIRAAQGAHAHAEGQRAAGDRPTDSADADEGEGATGEGE